MERIISEEHILADLERNVDSAYKEIVTTGTDDDPMDYRYLEINDSF